MHGKGGGDTYFILRPLADFICVVASVNPASAKAPATAKNVAASERP